MAEIGIDFGTTNSAIAIRQGDTVNLARFDDAETFRSVLYFPAGRKPVLGGPAAIENYLEEHAEGESGGRLIQSVKSLLGTRSFTATNIGGRRYNAQDLVTVLLRLIRSAAGDPDSKTGVTAGRPVRFVGAETPEDEQMAADRLIAAFGASGWGQARLALEPIGAAHSYESRLDHDELILIADFGGGTSDFCLMPVGPSARQAGRKRKVLGYAGVPLAGDAIDAAIIRNVVTPLLGEGTSYRSLNKTLPVPASVYRKLERWHQLSFLRAPDVMRTLQSIEANALEPERIAKLIALVENDLGLQLHRAVQKAKFELSKSQTAQFRFVHSALEIEQTISRADFEEWIEPELDQIRSGVDRLLEETRTELTAVDRVFLTGGTSLVPAVRRVFEHLFGPERMSGGDEFTSVARGLALMSGQTRK